MVKPDFNRLHHQCLRKVMYRTRKEAHTTAKVMSAKWDAVIIKYKCDYGDHWHIGNYRPACQREDLAGGN